MVAILSSSRPPPSVHIVDVQSETPEVPFGTYFHVRLRYCLTHEAPGRTRVRIGYVIVFSKNTMLKVRSAPSVLCST
jgi:hypothetical protein